MSTDSDGRASSIVSEQNEATSEDGVLGPEEAYRFFDEQVRTVLGMSGAELARRWDDGEYRDRDDSALHSEIIGLMMLRPQGRAKRE